jgi:hypothetical protein
VTTAFDHVILAVRDLDVAGDRLTERFGLVSVAGGRHHGLGTGNRIVPLGGEYLELMAVVDAGEAAGGPLGPWLDAALAGGEGPVALCLRTDDIGAVARRLDTEPTAMSRVRPDGRVLAWRLAGLDGALGPDRLPFFIQWDTPAGLHPGATPVNHDVHPTGIVWVELGGDAGRAAATVGDAALDLRFVAGPPGVRRVGIGLAGGAELVIEDWH